MIIAWLVLTGRWNVLYHYDIAPAEFISSAALAAFEVVGEILALAFLVGLL